MLILLSVSYHSELLQRNSFPLNLNDINNRTKVAAQLTVYFRIPLFYYDVATLDFD